MIDPLPPKVGIEALREHPDRIDVRSPSEFAIDHIPGAVNLPVLDDAERAEVGTIHAKESGFAAKRHGAGFGVEPNDAVFRAFELEAVGLCLLIGLLLGMRAGGDEKHRDRQC